MSAEERTGWRDVRLSLKHREWGTDLPAVDIDHVLVEYNHEKVNGLIEYKHERGTIGKADNPNYAALADLGNRAQIPFFVVRYTDNFKWWTMMAFNERAKLHLPKGPETLSEREFVAVLYALRRQDMPADHKFKVVPWDWEMPKGGNGSGQTPLI